MANRWRKQWKQWQTFFVGGGCSKITTDGDCSHEIKRNLLLGRKVMTNLDSILKSRDFTLSTKVHLVKTMGFPVVMYWCESWTIKKAEHRRTDAFELWCWRRLLRVPWSARRFKGDAKGNQSWIFIGRTAAVAETLATWCKELTHLKRPLWWERLRAREGDDRGWDGWMASPTQWTWFWVHSRSWWWTGRPGMLQSMGLQRVRHDWATELNWMEPNIPQTPLPSRLPHHVQQNSLHWTVGTQT